MNNLLSKVKRKLGDLLGKVIPHNTSLRPIDVYTSSNEYLRKNPSAGHYAKIYDGYAYRADLPADLRSAAERFEKLESQASLPDVVVVSVSNGRLYHDSYNTVAIVAPDNYLLHDISLELRGRQQISPHVNHIFKIKYFNKPRKIQGAVFTLLTGGGGLDNYFHWLFDVLPRLHLLKASGLYNDVKFFLVPNYKFPYQIDTLNLLGIAKEQVIDATTCMHLQADQLIASSPHRNAGQMEKWACDFLRDSFIPADHDDKDALPKFIYISRNDSKSRNVLNEAALVRLLEGYGCKTVSLTGLTFLDQVRLFNNADVIISPHGAGLANLVFCKPGTRIVEVFSEGWIGTMYWDLAGKLGLRYYYHIATVSEPPKTAAEAKHKHFEVDIAYVERILASFKNSTT